MKLLKRYLKSKSKTQYNMKKRTILNQSPVLTVRNQTWVLPQMKMVTMMNKLSSILSLRANRKSNKRQKKNQLYKRNYRSSPKRTNKTKILKSISITINLMDSMLKLKRSLIKMQMTTLLTNCLWRKMPMLFWNSLRKKRMLILKDNWEIKYK